MPKILLVHPDFSRLGGIENYFLKIKPHFTMPHISCGNSSRPGEKGIFSRIKRIINDYLKFWELVSSEKITTVHLNPSLQTKMFYRDFIYLWIAKLYRKKTVVFFHGWDTDFENSLNKNNGRKFLQLYGRADAFIVLAASFTQSLRQWGVTQPIYQEVIVIEDEVYNSIQIEQLIIQRNKAPIKQLLFPSRLIRKKGLLTTIRVLDQIQQRFPKTGLTVAGDGEDAEQAQQLVTSLKLSNTHFTGIVSGSSKYKLFEQSHFLCFPTEHSEGFPNTIVESMAFGLPVITRPVGGVKDFFINGEHGFMSDSVQPEVFSGYIEKTISSGTLYEEIARKNHEYAGKHFLASQAAKRLQNIYQSL